MIFLIKMMSGEGITLENEEALEAFLKEANAGKKLVITKYGIVNVASIDSIIPHKEKMKDVLEMIKYGKSKEDAEKEALGVSPFAKLLAGKLPQLK